jgi:hypothetical protein
MANIRRVTVPGDQLVPLEEVPNYLDKIVTVTLDRRVLCASEGLLFLVEDAEPAVQAEAQSLLSETTEQCPAESAEKIRCGAEAQDRWDGLRSLPRTYVYTMGVTCVRAAVGRCPLKLRAELMAYRKPE